MDELVDDDAIEILLRSPEEIASRLIIVSSIVRRAALEHDGSEVDDEPEALRFDLLAWLQSEGLDSQLTHHERELLEAKIETIAPDEVTAASWQGEAVVALGWVHGLVEEMPGYDQPADSSRYIGAVPSPWSSTAAFRSQSIARSEASIAEERERAEIWHWRSEVAELLKTANYYDCTSLLDAVREVAREANQAGHLAVRDDDFDVGGRAYHTLRVTEREDLGALATVRLQSLNWVCGFGGDWDAVPLQL